MDGNTATTLAPSEEEMGKVGEVFTRMRDAVIDASKLASEVADLRREVESLRSEIKAARDSNHWLDSQLVEVRQQRDQALRDKAAALDSLNTSRGQVVELEAKAERQRAELARLNDEVATLKRERDEAGLRALELEDVNDKLREDLEKIRAVLEPKAEAAEQGRDASGQFLPKAAPEPEPENRPSYEQVSSDRW